MKGKILGISGSPRRNSNTDRLVKHVLESSGMEYEMFKLSDMNIRPCRACNGCTKTNICVVKDDFPELAEKILEADALVIGAYTPYSLLDGYTKAMLERFYSFRHRNNLIKGKYLVSIVASLNDTIRKGGHNAIVMEAVLERMNHVAALDITGSSACITCGSGDTCEMSSSKAKGIPADEEKYIKVETQNVWSEGEKVGEKLAKLIQGEEEFIPSHLSMELLEVFKQSMKQHH